MTADVMAVATTDVMAVASSAGLPGYVKMSATWVSLCLAASDDLMQEWRSVRAERRDSHRRRMVLTKVKADHARQLLALIALVRYGIAQIEQRELGHPTQIERLDEAVDGLQSEIERDELAGSEEAVFWASDAMHLLWRAMAWSLDGEAMAELVARKRDEGPRDELEPQDLVPCAFDSLDQMELVLDNARARKPRTPSASARIRSLARQHPDASPAQIMAMLPATVRLDVRTAKREVKKARAGAKLPAPGGTVN